MYDVLLKAADDASRAYAVYVRYLQQGDEGKAIRMMLVLGRYGCRIEGRSIIPGIVTGQPRELI